MNRVTFSKGFYKFQNSLIIWAVLLSVSLTAMAQSGRKPTKQSEVQPQSKLPPLENSSQRETPAFDSEVSVKPTLSKTSILIASNIPETMYLQFPFPEKMERWIFDRLSKSPVLDIRNLGSNLNRKEVIKRAKTETQILTVLLELEEDFLEVPRPNQRTAQPVNAWINYYIFLPGSGKLKYHGRTYLNPGLMPTGANKAGICYPGVRGNDLLLLKASIEVADRIMSDLGVRIPPVCSSEIQLTANNYFS